MTAFAVALQDTGNLLSGVAVAVFLARLTLLLRGCFSRARALDSAVDWLLAGGCGLWGIGALLRGHWLAAAVNLTVAALIAWSIWRRRRKDRAPKSLGDESRILIAALVRKMRQAAKPRPVLRPAPGGAR